MGALAKFASYIAIAIGAVLLALGGFAYVDFRPGPAMVLVVIGGVCFSAGIVGGMKINSDS